MATINKNYSKIEWLIPTPIPFFLIRIYQDWQAQIKAAYEKVKGEFLHNNKN